MRNKEKQAIRYAESNILLAFKYGKCIFDSGYNKKVKMTCKAYSFKDGSYMAIKSTFEGMQVFSFKNKKSFESSFFYKKYIKDA